jgi:cytochrome P450
MATVLEAPGPKRTLWPGGQALGFQRDPLGFLTRLAGRYGDVSQFRVGAQRAFFVNHPDLIRDLLITHHERFHKGRALQRAKRLLGEGLLTSEEDFHRRQRRLAQPAFHRQRINSYGATMVDYAERLSDRWREGQTLDVSQEMMRLTLAIVGKTLFDADVESEADEIGEALTDVMELFRYLMIPYSELLEHFPLLPQSRRFNRARARLDAVIYRIIEDRRRDGRDHGDLLSMLLLAVDEEGDRTGMTNEQLRDEAMTIFLAGHETTANALAWTFYLLARNPEAERRLHEELDGVLAGREPAVEDVPNLRHTEMVLAETMRLYPPAWALGRTAVADHEAGGYHIPRGSLVLASQFVMHRDPRYFPDPERFDPERFTPEARAARPPFSYFPFGGGVRRCVGEGFAWMEMLLTLASLARRWRLRLPAGRRAEMQPRITLRPGRGGIPVTLERRT